MGQVSETWPEAAGELLSGILGDTEPRPGGPYVHTFKMPEPIGEDEDGNPVYPEPLPAFTLTERPVADVVREAGFGPVPERVQVTYLTGERTELGRWPMPEVMDRCPGCGALITEVPAGHSWAISLADGEWSCMTGEPVSAADFLEHGP